MLFKISYFNTVKFIITVLKFTIWMGVVSRNFRNKEEIASVNDQDMQ